MRKIVITAVMLLLGGALAPASAQNREHQQMAGELRMLQEQQQQLALTFAQLADAIKALNARLDDVNNTMRKGLADQKLVIDGMGNDLRTIRERTDDTSVRLGTIRDEIDALRTTVTTLSQAQTAPPAPIEPLDPNAPAPPAPTPAVPTPSTAGLSPTRMYQTAFADYTSGQYSLATTGFEQFIRTFPRSEMADDAQFFIGEAQYMQNKFADAIAAYNAVIQNYPMGDQVPLALYKRGQAQQQLGQVDAARASWQLVIDKFPDSDGARLAKQRLDALSRQQPRP
jgi:tol-pal system protein YbgF